MRKTENFRECINPEKNLKTRSERYDNHICRMYPSIPRKVTNKYELYDFEDKMHRWTEVDSNSYSKRFHRDSTLEANDSFVARSVKQIEDYYGNEQNVIEAPIRKYEDTDKKNNSDANDEYYYRSTIDRQNKRWREVEERPARERQNNSQKEAVVDDLWEMPVLRPSLIVGEDNLKKELFRSKSTSDMFGSQKTKKLEVWKGSEEPDINRSMVNVSAKTSAGRYTN